MKQEVARILRSKSAACWWKLLSNLLTLLEKFGTLFEPIEFLFWPFSPPSDSIDRIVCAILDAIAKSLPGIVLGSRRILGPFYVKLENANSGQLNGERCSNVSAVLLRTSG